MWVARLKDKDAAVRREAAHALGRLEPPTAAAVPPLIGALKDEDKSVRVAAASALAYGSHRSGGRNRQDGNETLTAKTTANRGTKLWRL